MCFAWVLDVPMLMLGVGTWCSCLVLGCVYLGAGCSRGIVRYCVRMLQCVVVSVFLS